MDSRPILLVQQDPPPPGEPSLADAALGLTPVTAQQAIRSVSAHEAEVVVCGRFPGWQALVARVTGSGGACVLWGAPPSPAESGQLFHSELEVAGDPAELFHALRRARARLTAAGDAARDDELEQRVQLAKRIGRFAQSIAAQIDLPNVVEEAIDRARELCEADGASVLLVDPESGELCFEVVSGGSELIAKLRLKPGQGVAGRVAQSARAMLVTDVASSPDFSASFDRRTGFRTGSIIAVPLLLSGDVIGVLEAVRAADTPPFDAESLERLEELSPHVAIAVHNAQVSAHLRESQVKVLEANAQLEHKVRQRTAQIARHKREWEQTFDAISEPIAQVEGHTVLRVNRAWAERAGVPVTEAAGKRCYELFAGRNSPCPGCPLNAPGERAEGELALSDGTQYRASRFAMSDGAPGEARAVMHYRDVTRERAMEAKLREQERMVALSRLADGAAHEINNPLAFVTSNLNALRRMATDLEGLAESFEQQVRRPNPTEAVAALREATQTLSVEDATEWREMLDESLQGAHRVAEIVRALRALSRQERLTDQPSDVNAVTRRCAQAELASHDAVELELQATRAAGLPPLQLEQVLNAILKNARQAVVPGQRVTVTTSDAGSGVLVEIRDTGCGIAPEHLSRVFEPFFTTRKLGQGLGLGLTAAWGVVNRCGGELSISSEPEVGTVVQLRLPTAVGPVSGLGLADPPGVN